MRKAPSISSRVLAVAPSSRGFGFAVLEHENNLVDWGVRSTKGDKNLGSIAKVDELIAHYGPGAIVLEDHSAKSSRRSPRIRTLITEMCALAERSDIRAVQLSQAEVRKIFFARDQGTKHSLAGILAARFPAELGFRLPPKRRPWMSEDYRMDIFDAVALAVASWVKKRSPRNGSNVSG
jgi:hypothetical protein